ncbi:MAG: shikimate dehydrogenase [Actinobacteria bacterium]|uniref:Unannotated protein n=1 Tax=freshwater metagenome TaxID=449393 RepID=A0A6J6P1I9_9ZZZZ|nr:shikimate dehydrogenase [Actinomycetota bacterium]
MIRAGVAGSPISHSLSPRIHRKALEILGLEGEYEAFEVGQNEFTEFLAAHSIGDWNGFSLTMPLKESAFGLIENIDQDATRINSVNTIYRSDSKWCGTSTDYLAFKKLLKVSKDSKVAIIGAGGTARAALGSLDSRIGVADVLIRNESRKSAMSNSAPHVRINFLEMNAPLDGYDLVVQTTPAGAFDPYVDSIAKLSGSLVEALYKPAPTKLAMKFSELNCSVITGKELLVEQALYQIELFSGSSINFDEMRSALLAEISEL